MPTDQKTRPFLKWAGGKYQLLDKICSYLPSGSCLIEPFVGSGALFLNTNYKRYILNDINPDLIQLYQTVQQHGEDFIAIAKNYFSTRHNTQRRYYQLRKLFNETDDIIEKSALFLYLNRHGYNGLCRYNNKGQYNVPYGYYKKPYFPEKELLHFHQKSQKAEFVCQPFNKIMLRARKGQVIYCDPPYIPLSKSASFTKYHTHGFGEAEQLLLAAIAEKISQRGISVLISNHDTKFTQHNYQHARLISFKARRRISCHAKNRKPVKELLAIFNQ